MIAKNAGNAAGAKGCRFEIIPKAGWTASKLNRATRQREPTRSVKRNTHRAWKSGLKRFQPDDVVSITDPNRFGVSIFPRAMESNGHWACLALKTGSYNIACPGYCKRSGSLNFATVRTGFARIVTHIKRLRG
ncbi:hypothetical protein sS8_4224 [Methylocaldum marinum]|uniref:Uncharacterized protein n=1 Tax=Methylocaldum marinum TaxID=1432792 RepID=A0A250KXB1_9GAMM|nr:hypothetical protein sS8_4224 [Methylocaldum marinum]